MAKELSSFLKIGNNYININNNNNDNKMKQYINNDN
jgi:hypothetical protein